MCMILYQDLLSYEDYSRHVLLFSLLQPILDGFPREIGYVQYTVLNTIYWSGQIAGNS